MQNSNNKKVLTSKDEESEENFGNDEYPLTEGNLKENSILQEFEIFEIKFCSDINHPTEL